jgi:DNA-binding response OmpR family regulator
MNWSRFAMRWSMLFLVGAALILGGYAFVDAPLARWAHRQPLRRFGRSRRADAVRSLAGSFVAGVAGAGGRRYRLRRVTPLDRVAWPAALGVGLVSLLEVPLKFAFGRTGLETFYHDYPSLPSDNVYGFHPFLRQCRPRRVSFRPRRRGGGGRGDDLVSRLPLSIPGGRWVAGGRGRPAGCVGSFRGRRARRRRVGRVRGVPRDPIRRPRAGEEAGEPCLNRRTTSMSVPKIPLCILVVEDDAISRNLLTAVLTGEGYQVMAASDGMSGLVAAKNRLPDLAILDLHLPDMSGIELAGLLQPEVPFLALTIERSPEALQACTEKGALGYLVKPLAAETFLRHVHVALERGREQRNLRRALKDNPAINKALGILIGYLLLSEQQAFETLIAYATARNLKTLDLAHQIVAAMTRIHAAIEAGASAEAALRKDREEAQLFLDEFRPHA